MSGGRDVRRFEYALRPWQGEVMAALRRSRFNVVVAHRRAGKTEAAALHLLLCAMRQTRAHPAPLYGYVAPFLNQAKAVAWARLKYYARALPGLRTSETDLSLTLWNGATVRLFGADHPDRLRGLGFDGVVMDEVAQMRPAAWPAVVRPALADRRGWAAFIGTPRGQNGFFELYQTALRQAGDGQWRASLFPADRTGLIPPGELASLRAEMPDDLFRQEFLCDFTADNARAFMEFRLVQEAAARALPAAATAGAPLVLGLDVARFGDDRTAVALRQGPRLVGLKVWASMREWLAGAAIPDDQALKADLLAPNYDYDPCGRLKIESKDDLKKRGLRSPDLADALALTFAQPVAAPGARRPAFALMEG